ncbi:hypothetical protein M9H77_36012 [Catharanthus roseus]|uniref:Uncharacterized protein n=1 Tax=Catharanthus roseus TaxID=4058 RepID=A0ACB9ZST4_CATRO|nr:hypothetical protein M9H77_36012 [Catharanthus roseus]
MKEQVAEVEELEREKERERQVKVGGRDISFDDRMLNTILGTPDNTTRLYENEVIKLKTLKTKRMVRDCFIRSLCKTP